MSSASITNSLSKTVYASGFMMIVVSHQVSRVIVRRVRVRVRVRVRMCVVCPGPDKPSGAGAA